MGSGDLNMKKSWHPLTMANQRRVAEEKRKAEEEAQRTAKMQKELRAERQREEMERLNQSLSGKKTNQLEWMYKAPTVASQTDEDLEAYLLGKRSIADIIDTKEKADAPEDKWKGDMLAFSNRNVNSERDLRAKDMEDPLVAIKRREQEAIQRMMSNPLYKKDTQKTKKSRSKDKKRDSSKDRDEERRHRHRHRNRHNGSSRSIRDGIGSIPRRRVKGQHWRQKQQPASAPPLADRRTRDRRSRSPSDRRHKSSSSHRRD
ncbi:hypothetical protein DL89DRAFT_264421 [Linderina pennispora]|uniref:CBF1-interacting co-repressor CIR N-terminal domain-containing protein n=1 Tax=Linderina pennispora TaxID=61395 RepID=A0A1Y1WLY7_9FUNG|nr:uncharacterized protein DL89DRAFT_264421 [Linderina pennispora]ORX74581.1 hypothetical protein DL89DRAFT_264421 [Linderina pennispora]